MNDAAMRAELVKLLEGDQAHVSVRKALEGIKPENCTAIAIHGERSIWEQLEHMRLAQLDILRYTVDPDWKSPKWPEGYWPVVPDKLTSESWKESVSGFERDLQELIDLVENKDLDLTAKIPHADTHTYLREVLLVADHNAYHLGQIVAMRKALNDWPS
jgi:hypothetical protein